MFDVNIHAKHTILTNGIGDPRKVTIFGESAVAPQLAEGTINSSMVPSCRVAVQCCMGFSTPQSTSSQGTISSCRRLVASGPPHCSACGAADCQLNRAINSTNPRVSPYIDGD